jgi:hypothetical protein
MRASLHTRGITNFIAITIAVSLYSSVLAREASALPQHLSKTGLYVAGSISQIRTEHLAFSPQYPLWSDGATKRRWLSLPPRTAIDASNPDAWEFPRGTRLWKEFSFGRAIETRFIERLSDGTWRYATYIWNAEGTDAVLAPASGLANLPLSNLPGHGETPARYDVPAEADCRACHEGNAVPVLGFSTLQLSPDRDPLAPHADIAGAKIEQTDLAMLVARGLLKNLPRSYIEHPPRINAATPTERAAIGYLHGNCGHCHNDLGSLAPLELSLSQTQSTQSATTLRSLVGEHSRFRMQGVDQHVVPGRAASSALIVRMQSRNPLMQMPPIGTNKIDTEALTLIERWINHDLSLQPENTP